VLVWFKDEIFVILGIELTSFMVFLLGYFSDSVWKNIKTEKAKQLNVDAQD